MPMDAPTGGAAPDAARLRAEVVARARRPLAPDVHRALVAQNAAIAALSAAAASPARDAHLAQLASGAAAVVTGQQVGLFLGPLYTLYKAASAIAIARALSAETGAPVVPVFWLQTEDHDLVEIASCGVPGRTACEALSVPVDAANRISVWHHQLPAELAGCLDALSELLGEGASARAHEERLRRHYRPGARWVDAFTGVLAELFAPEGLVFLDPRDPALAAAAAPVHARALEQAPRISEDLIAHDRELTAAGRPTPVHVRPGAPLSFFHPDGAEGPRVRLAPAGGDTYVEICGEHGAGDTGPRTYRRAELLAALAADPRRFSTSALLRPLLQDELLPTAAYVGGPGEVAYLAQLPPVYRLFDRPPPLVLPRARFRVICPRSRRLLDRLGLAAADAERAEEELLSRLRRPAAHGVARRLLDPFTATHAELSAELAGAGPQMAKALARTRASVERAVSRFAAKVERAALYEDASLVESVRGLCARLGPGGAPQERVLGLPALAPAFGDRGLVERVLAAVRPFDPTLQELS